MTPEIDLSGLRDLHLLSQPSVWPLATGWWVLIGFFIIICLGSFLFYRIWRQKPSVYAIRKLKKMEGEIGDDLIYLKNISQLLKRVAIAVYGRPQIAPLSDQKWQDFLLSSAPHTLTKQEARWIAFAPYESKFSGVLDRPLLTDHLCLWIKKVFENKKSS